MEDAGGRSVTELGVAAIQPKTAAMVEQTLVYPATSDEDGVAAKTEAQNPTLGELRPRAPELGRGRFQHTAEQTLRTARGIVLVPDPVSGRRFRLRAEPRRFLPGRGHRELIP
jgi:hypothetical protein